ncbi:hypothetical protein PR048_024309 [Dryococelus australis]|uniref:Uncharacterized protein n=1 Tax=Dryococelus australis TaxID=614101 RepID=A0ABQ9GN78_9NEOP|nr:hypothetical protein PR048_024309 [Dryococelus australis]
MAKCNLVSTPYTVSKWLPSHQHDTLSPSCRGQLDGCEGEPIKRRGRGGVVVRLLVSHHGESRSTSDRVSPGFSHVRIVPDDAADRRVFFGISCFLSPFIPALLHSSLHPHQLSISRSRELRNQVHYICMCVAPKPGEPTENNAAVREKTGRPAISLVSSSVAELAVRDSRRMLGLSYSSMLMPRDMRLERGPPSLSPELPENVLCLSTPGITSDRTSPALSIFNKVTFPLSKSRFNFSTMEAYGLSIPVIRRTSTLQFFSDKSLRLEPQQKHAY